MAKKEKVGTIEKSNIKSNSSSISKSKKNTDIKNIKKFTKKPMKSQVSQTLPKDDPNYLREKSKYDKPIASREYLLDLIEKNSNSLSYDQIASKIKVKSEDQKEALIRRLKAMVRDGQLFVKLDKTYSSEPVEDEVIGVFALNDQRQGVLLMSDHDIKVRFAYQQMRGLFVGDKVSAKLMPSKDINIYKVSSYEIISRAIEKCEGQYIQAEGIGYVIPTGKHSHQQILVLPKDRKSADHQDLVEIDINIYPTDKTPAIGYVKKVLPQKRLVDLLVDQLSADFAQPEPWGVDVLKAVAKQQSATKKRSWAKKALKEDSLRKDLRKLPFMTIDGSDAKDFDDAIYCCEKDDKSGWVLYVAIADVSYFVDAGSKLDLQAQLRATSIYFPTKVIPMLPEGLSNDLCSLMPNVDRASLVCQMSVNSEGQLEGYEFYPGLIHSHARLTYNEAWVYLSSKFSNKKHKVKKVDKSLRCAHKLHLAVTEDRRKTGSLTLDLPEQELALNSRGEIDKINSLERNGAHVMIESCMLLANISAARFLEESSLPGIYRVHEAPQDDKKAALMLFLRHRGFKVPRKLTIKAISDVLLKAKQMPEFNLIQMFVLRSMMQAVYHTKNKGHFGLGFTEYTHFTSPIRRYPDLIVHRLIKSNLYNKKSPYAKIADLDSIAQYASTQERIADDYSRKVVNALKCHYLKHYLGQKHKAVIASVLPFGFFAQLDEIMVDGMVHISNLQDDYYIYDEMDQILVGEKFGKRYGVGDEILVRVSKVDLEQYRVDFQLVASLR